MKKIHAFLFWKHRVGLAIKKKKKTKNTVFNISTNKKKSHKIISIDVKIN